MCSWIVKCNGISSGSSNLQITYWIEFLRCEVEEFCIHCSKVGDVPVYLENSVTCARRSMKLWVTSSYCFHLYSVALLDVGALIYFE